MNRFAGVCFCAALLIAPLAAQSLTLKKGETLGSDGNVKANSEKGSNASSGINTYVGRISSIAEQFPDLSQVGYEESHQLLRNPDRGLYVRLGSFGVNPVPSSLKRPYGERFDGKSEWAHLNTVSTVQLWFSLSDFMETDIDSKTLADIEKLLERAWSAGLTVIPRFYYHWGCDSDPGVCTSKDKLKSPEPNQILSHVKQISEVLNRHPKSISFVEAGFIGAWGEWHSDQYGHVGKHDKFRKKLLDTMLTSFSSDIFVAARYPVDIKKAGLKHETRIGLHHDCTRYMNDTYPKHRAFEITQKSPMAGEICQLDPKKGLSIRDHKKRDELYGCNEMRTYFDKFNFDLFFGLDWVGALGRFERQGCLEEIVNRLGYRYLITGSYYEDGILYFSVKNVGFGKSFKARAVTLKLSENEFKTDIDVRDWHSGGEFFHSLEIGETTLEEGKLEIEGNVRFANEAGNTIFLHR